MIFSQNPQQSPLRDAITNAYRKDEAQCVKDLLNCLNFSTKETQQIDNTAKNLMLETRKRRQQQGGIDAFLQQYDLSTEEGIALMCLAEALLRIPDSNTVDRMISDKLSTAEWEKHLSRDNSLFVNAATWSLMLTGKVFAPTLSNEKNLSSSLKRFFSRAGSELIRPIVLQAMKIIGKQFVMGRTIDEALERAKATEAKGYRYSYDMLGEAARTKEDAEKYFQAYVHAIDAIGQSIQSGNPAQSPMNPAQSPGNPAQSPGISIKLSALNPRYEFGKHQLVMKELVPQLLQLAKSAKKYNIGLTVDAEEADRLELSLDVIEAVFSNPALDGWEGFGLAVQSYQKRAPFVIDWLADLSKKHKRRIMIRLIKGAYWDAEIKISQVLGLEGYPVFTRKNSTDVSFIACAKKIFGYGDCFYPQFGTHNTHSVAVILELAQGRTDFEFQCLHGMGEPLYDQIVTGMHGLTPHPCRIYAPVGSHKDLLGYLVRRLLENGANTSFINRISDEKLSIEEIIADPVARIARLTQIPHPNIPLPRNIYENVSGFSDINVSRLNSKGFDFSNVIQLNALKKAMDAIDNNQWVAGPILNGKVKTTGSPENVTSPANHDNVVGTVYPATADDVSHAISNAKLATKTWGETNVATRSEILERAADLFEQNIPRLMTLLCREAGKYLTDCYSEIRETVDFCRYYAARAREDFTLKELKGPTGEYNQLSLHPRGTIVCISPWNFPLAIFAGQIVAALVTGNSVIAKPAEQTPLIAAEAVRILLEAGIPSDALQLLPGQGSVIGAKLVADPNIDGVMFTGSTETAKRINQTLANRDGAIVPLIAETGGQNAMVVDSSSLPEQVVADVINSAFNSAGQRCSALRVLYVQEDIADSLIKMLKGAMQELSIGDPSLLSTDIGPVIDKEALQMLEQHAQSMQKEGTLLYQVPAENLTNGTYFAPRVFEINNIDVLKREVFGPILHVIRYAAKDLNKILDEIMATGYGLTMGIHSRIDATLSHVQEKMAVGNIYVNRNIVGAVVGVQPFGGEKLSGTGPKAGGPYYLPRLCVEHAISVNTTAAGGNTTLISLNEGD